MRFVRRYDQGEREPDGAVHWNSVGPKLRQAFQKSGGRKFSDTDWLQHMCEGSNKMRFQYCMNSKKIFLYVRAIQGHTGGNLTAPEWMGHVAIPCEWREFLFHRVCSFDVTSILKSGLIAGGRESKEGRQPSSSHLSTRSGTIQTKKHPAMTYQNREKYTVTVRGKILRTPSTGSI